MGELWVVGEPGPDHGLARISAEVATLAVALGASAGRDVVGVVVAAEPTEAATELARYLPRVLAIADTTAADVAWAAVAGVHLAALVGRDRPDLVLIGGGPDGRDVAGTLSALTGFGVLTNAVGMSWTADGLAVEKSVFGGKLLTTSGFTAGRGIVTVRPNVATATPAATLGRVDAMTTASEADALPAVRVLDRISEAGATAPIEEAKVIVAGGRGVGGAEGFSLVGELADALGGTVGATRAAVDSGWIPYSQQIGQTGKIVKPDLYLALGISGAIQHKVGMQTAGTIVAVNRDPDAPIAEFADLLVVGDLFEVGSALLERLRSRSS